MKKVLFASVMMVVGCGRIPPVAKDYKITQKEVIHEISYTFAVKDPMSSLFSQVGGKSDTDVTVTGEGIFADVNLKKHFASAKNDHFSLSLVKQPDGKVTVKITGAPVDTKQELSYETSFEAEFTHGSFEDLKTGKEVALNLTAKGREMLTQQTISNVKNALFSTAQFLSTRLAKANKKADIGEVRVDKISMGDSEIRGTAKKLEFITKPSEIETSVNIRVKE